MPNDNAPEAATLAIDIVDGPPNPALERSPKMVRVAFAGVTFDMSPGNATGFGVALIQLAAVAIERDQTGRVVVPPPAPSKLII